MILAIITFLLARVGITAVLNWMATNTVALWSILSILIFAGFAMTFIPGAKDKPSKAKKWGWICFVGAILAYVALGLLKPIAQIVAIVLAAIVAVVAVIAIKRPLFKWLKTARIATWAAWILRLI